MKFVFLFLGVSGIASATDEPLVAEVLASIFVVSMLLLLNSNDLFIAGC
jgi:hypothetical protein